MKSPRISPSLRIALLYLAAATLWIYLSDRALTLFTDDPALLTRLSIYKGIGFVVVTSLLLFFERRHSDERTRYLISIVESSDDAIMSRDTHGRITSWNHGAEIIYGFSKAEVLGEPISKYFPPEVSEELRNISERITRGEKIDHFESIYRRKDGNQIDLSITASPIHDERGRLVGSSSIARDVTERKRIDREARMQQMQLLQASKMASVGILATGIAHEINNPNNYVLLNSKIISRAWNDVRPILAEYHKQNGDFNVAGIPYSTAHPQIDRLVSGIAEGAHRIQQIVQGLKDFSRLDSGDLNQAVAVNTVLQSAITIVRSLITQSTDFFTLEAGENLPEVRGNTQQLEQVMMNLITNACHALRNRNDRITVTSALDEQRGLVILQVADTGTGIPREHMASIMDPFFTTKRDRGGTGLGLSISYNIVKNHGGEMRFESEPGKGTTARVLLPARTSSAS